MQVLDTQSFSNEDTGMCFDTRDRLYATNWTASSISVFSRQAALLYFPWGSGYASHPESCIFDADGDVYVGQADGGAQVLKFDANGQLLATYSPSREGRGTDWVDLASDQCTLYYTSEGPSVRRFDVCLNQQLADFSGPLPSSPCYAMRIRPNREVLAACSANVVRLDPDGGVLQTYPGQQYPLQPSFFFALNLDPDGTSFWTGDYATGQIYRIDIQSGTLIKSFPSNQNTTLAGLTIFGEITVAQPSPTPNGTGTPTPGSTSLPTATPPPTSTPSATPTQPPSATPTSPPSPTQTRTPTPVQSPNPTPRIIRALDPQQLSATGLVLLVLLVGIGRLWPALARRRARW